MSGFPECDAYDALGLAELVRAGQVSSAELVEECISRIERVNPHINSVVFELIERSFIFGLPCVIGSI
jgi:Asp-tRNA(Asn)/Glu-tRNA(Gln) amidotransferase A subunit family amidase